MNSQDTLALLAREIGIAFKPLEEAFSSPENFESFAARLGWDVDVIPQPIADLTSGITTVISAIEEIFGPGVSISASGEVSEAGASGGIEIDGEDIQALINGIKKIIEGIQAIASAPDSTIPAVLRDDDFKDKFPRQLIDYIIVTYLKRSQKQVYFILKFFGVITEAYQPPTGNRLGYMQMNLELDRLGKLFTDPVENIENAFGWGNDTFNFSKFADAIVNLGNVIGVDSLSEYLDKNHALAVEEGASPEGDPLRESLRLVFFERIRNSGRLAAEVRAVGLPTNGPLKPGLALLPAFNGILDFKMQLGPDIAVTLGANLNLEGGVGLIFRPSQPMRVLTGFEDDAAPSEVSGQFEVLAEYSKENEATILLGSKGGSRIEFTSLSGKGGLYLHSDNKQDLYGEFELKGARVIISAGEGDGFIQTILPGDGITAGFDLAVGVSTLRGIYFRGTAGLEIAIPTHISLGPIEVESLIMAIGISGEKIPINVGATIKASLGPLFMAVENMGISATFSFPPDKNGTLGPLDFNIGFKPPNGVAISVDAGIVKGGGYLFLDFDKGEYAGALELTFSEIVSLKAIGIINTKMPDGADGFSMIIIITAEFGSGFQLGFGFVLLGVGGLLGLNRTMALQALAEGVRTGGVNGIMFPTNIVENAPRILSDMRAFFPIEEGKFLIGPMAKLGWGTPALITVSLGIIIEIPGNIAILGVLKVALPTEDAPLIVIQINFIGAIEFDKERLWFFASLFESRVLFITLEGEMGLLVAWGKDASFVVSVGDFHPAFTPPPLPFPSPRRIAISILNESWGRIRVTGYFAVTSNTVQFGAGVEIYFGFDALNVDGHLAFDALFQFSPFYMIIAISCSLSVKVFGIGLFSVRIKMSLEGPTPWRAKGSGSISLLFFDVDVDFDFTWGESENTTLPPIEVMPLLVTEFNKLENWKAALPAGNNNTLVSLRVVDESEELVLHPTGTLHVSQRFVPLGLTLDKVGTQKPSDANKFELKLEDGSGLSKKSDLNESFAMAQFQEMESSKKLSRPSFEEEESGLEMAVTGAQVATGRAVKRIVRYELIVIDSNYKRFTKKFFNFFSGILFSHFLNGNAISNSALSHKTKKQYQPFEEKVQVVQGAYAVANVMNNKAFNESATTFSSEAKALEFMQQQVKANPNLKEELHVIPQPELNTAA